MKVYFVVQNKELESFKNEIDKLRQNQLTEIDSRCREVESLKEQLSGQLESLQEDNSVLAEEVANLTSEKKQLLDKLSCSELKLTSQPGNSDNKCSRLLHKKEALEERVTKLSEMVEQLQTSNAALRSQDGEVQRYYI